MPESSDQAEQAEHVMSFDCPCAECVAAFHPSIEERMRRHRIYGGKVVTRIEVEYEDGSIVGASGCDAFEIMCWWDASEAMNCIHGAVYRGPKLKPLAAQPPTEREEAPGEKV